MNAKSQDEAGSRNEDQMQGIRTERTERTDPAFDGWWRRWRVHIWRLESETGH